MPVVSVLGPLWAAAYLVQREPMQAAFGLGTAVSGLLVYVLLARRAPRSPLELDP